jgi:exodeoxyribonuclease V beta subunit
MRALDPLALPLEGVRLVEASAGSGKTYTITTLYLRLVLERGLEVPEVLVVTYTNAATEELRERVRKRLREALAVAAGGDGDEVLRALLARASEPAGVTQRLADALTRLDEASVFTIHGFCQRVLQENAFESGALYDPELVGDDADLRREVVEDFWRRRFYRAGADEVEWALGLWKTPLELLQEVLGLLGPSPVRVLPEPDLAASEARLRECHAQARAAWQAGREEVAALLAGPALSRNSYGSARVALALDEVERHLGSDSPPADRAAVGELLTAPRLVAATKKGQVAPAHPFFERWQAYLSVHREAFEARRVALLREAVAYLRAELSARKAARRVLFFDDLLAQLDQALHGPSGEALAARLRARHPAALIDEFQDTDPLQYRIFRRVYAGQEGCALVLVGDPKQSIYGFRGADLFTYLAARRDTDPEQGRFTLPTNRRSRPALVAAVNGLFGRSPRPFAFDEVQFVPAVAAPDPADEPLRFAGAEPPPLVVWFVPRDEDNTARRGPRLIRLDWARERVARACAEAVVGLLESGARGEARLGGRELRARDLAVLVRDRFEAGEVQAALRRAGVASAFLSRDSVFASETAADLARVLAAMAEPHDEGLVRAALCTLPLGWSAGRLDALSRDDGAWEAELERFRELGRLWRERGPLPAIERLVDQAGVAGRLLALPDGERRLTDLMQLAELLHLRAREHTGPEGLLRWLADRRGLGRGEGEEEELRLESDQDVVSVVTVHRSKGLEYPIVFLPFPWTARAPVTRGPVAFHDPVSGQACVDLGADPDPARLAQAERERLAEDLRLLYVGLTRARYRVYLSWGAVGRAESSALGYLLRGPGDGAVRSLAELTDAEVRGALEALAREVPEGVRVEDLPPHGDRRWRDPGGGGAALAARPFAGVLDRSWRVASYSGLVSGHEAERPDYDPVPEPWPEAPSRGASFFAFPRGARSGSMLHRALGALDFPAARGPRLVETVDRELARGGFAPEWSPVVAEALGEVLDTPLDGEGLRLRAIEQARRRDELEFHYPLARLTAGALEGLLARFRGYEPSAERLSFSPVRGLMRGFIDLVFEWQGRFYLADYKSNHLGDRIEDYRPDALAAAMLSHRYDLQYLVYAVALHRYLGLRQPDYDYQRHFGGVYYLFLRGMRAAQGPRFGVFFDRPEAVLVAALDRLFARGEP